MPKKVNFSGKPIASNIDEFVIQGAEVSLAVPQEVKMKRLTLDIPDHLHRAIKRKAADEGVPMADLLRALLLEHYGNQ